MLLPLVASAQGVEIDGICYNLNAENKTAEVTRNPNYYFGEVAIPESVTYEEVTYSVTSIGEYAFSGCKNLSSVTIPNSVTSILFSAFEDCTGLTSITIPNSVTSVRFHAFEGTVWYDNQPDGLVYAGSCVYKYKGEMPNNTTVSIKEGTTCITDGAFDYCNGLTSITIPNSLTFIGNAAFNGCSGLTSVTIPNSVASIGSQAFMGCSGLTSVTIPNSVASIGSQAFMGCSGLTSVTISNSVTSIGGQAFMGCSSLTSIGVDADNTYYDSRDNCNAIIETASNTLIVGCKTTAIPNSVTSIGNAAFYGCSGLTSVTIPNSVTSIGDGAFRDCSGLTSVTIPNSVTSIGDGAFRDCSGLTSVVIPNSVTSISYEAFSGCGSLTSVIIPSSVTSISYEAFSGCIDLSSLVVESGNPVYDSRDNCNAIIETAKNMLIVGCKTTTIPNSVTSIGSDAFRGCSGLTSVTIPNSVASIGGSAFNGCSGLTSVTIPNSVTSISDDAFHGCSGLTSVTIPNSVTSIGSFAFLGCSGLTSVTIPNSVTSIEYSAFEGCSGLTSVIIPDKVTSIGERAFSDCINLTSLVVESGNPVYDSRDNCNAIIETAINTLIAGCKTTVIPNTVTSIGKYAFSGCSSLTSVTIPNSITAIVDGAFSGCGSLTSLTIPNSVTSIGYYVFEACSSLTSVTSLAQTPPFMRDGAFTNYDIPLYVPKGTRDAYLAASPWNKFKEIIEIEGTDEDEITIKDIGKTTWCSEYDLDFTNVAGIKAYTATGYDDISKTIWLTRVMKVPAGTGLLVKGDAGTYKIPHVSVRAYYTNLLVGNLGDAIKIEETDGDKTNYYLSGKDGSFVSVNGSANIGKNKAYLQLPTSVFGGTRSIGISYDDEDGTTGIKNLTPALSEGEGAWYTLQGQRVAKPGKGLYIKNGKKVIVR